MGPACYQRACWTVNTKSLTCDLLGGRTVRAGRKKGGCGVVGGVWRGDSLGSLGACQGEMGSSNWLYHVSCAETS